MFLSSPQHTSSSQTHSSGVKRTTGDLSMFPRTYPPVVRAEKQRGMKMRHLFHEEIFEGDHELAVIASANEHCVALCFGPEGDAKSDERHITCTKIARKFAKAVIEACDVIEQGDPQ